MTGLYFKTTAALVMALMAPLCLDDENAMAWLIESQNGPPVMVSQTDPLRSRVVFNKLVVSLGSKTSKWRIIKLQGPSVIPPPDKGEIHIVISANGTAKGFAGCNRFNGRYELSGDRLKFHNMSSTRKVCTDRMTFEQSFFAALELTEGWQIIDGYLELTSADRQFLARFQKVDS